LDKKVTKEELETVVLMDSMELMGQTVHPAVMANKEKSEQRGHPELKVQKEPQVRLANRVKKDQTDPREITVLKVVQEQTVLKESLGRMLPMVPKEIKDQLGMKENKVN